MSLRQVLPVLAFVSVLGCAKPASQQDTQADVAAINAVREREIAQVGTANVDSLVAVYTDDVMMMPPGEPAVHGRAAVKTGATGMSAQAMVRGGYPSAEL